MTSTREAIRDAIIDRTPLGKKYTSTAIATTSFTDDQVLKGPHPSSLVPRGSPLRIRDVTDANNAFEDTFSDVYNPATGNVTFEPDIDTITPAAADIMELWLVEVGHVSYVDDDIDLALTVDCGAWLPFVLTLVTDGDMETANADIATYWTGTNSTPTKTDATGFPRRFGRQTLFVDNTAANGYAYAATSINVVPSEAYRINVICRAAASTVALAVYDEDNTADITLAATATNTTERQWVMLQSTFTIPSGCYYITPRLGGAAATADTYWTALSLTRGDSTRISLPARITEMNRIGRVFQRMGSDVDKFYRGPDLEYDIEQVQDGYELLLPARVLGGSWPVYAEEWTNYAALATDIAETSCDLDYVVAHACRRIFQRLFDAEESKRTSREWVNRWSNLLREWRAEAGAMDAKHRGGYRPRIRYPQLQTAQTAV